MSKKILLLGSLADPGCGALAAELVRGGFDVVNVDDSDALEPIEFGKPKNASPDGRGSKGDRIRRRQQWRGKR